MSKKSIFVAVAVIVQLAVFFGAKFGAAAIVRSMFR